MNIAGHEIGRDHPPYVVGEVSGEHCGSIEKAKRLILALKNAGADAAKLQLFDPDRLAELRGGKDKVLSDGLWKGRSLGDLYWETWTPSAWFPELLLYAKEIGITLFSSVFDEDGIGLLQGLGSPALKIAAAESADERLVKAAKSTGLPLIISIGRNPVNWMWGYADAVLYCPPGYPCQLENMDLCHIRSITHTTVGFSDHSLGTVAATVAAGLGAVIIEKHITLDRKSGGPDASFSLEPHEFATLVRDVKLAWKARGNI